MLTDLELLVASQWRWPLDVACSALKNSISLYLPGEDQSAALAFQAAVVHQPASERAAEQITAFNNLRTEEHCLGEKTGYHRNFWLKERIISFASAPSAWQSEQLQEKR